MRDSLLLGPGKLQPGEEVPAIDHEFTPHRIEVPVRQHAGRSFVRVSVQACNSRAELAAMEHALAGAGL